MTDVPRAWHRSDARDQIARFGAIEGRDPDPDQCDASRRRARARRARRCDRAEVLRHPSKAPAATSTPSARRPISIVGEPLEHAAASGCASPAPRGEQAEHQGATSVRTAPQVGRELRQRAPCRELFARWPPSVVACVADEQRHLHAVAGLELEEHARHDRLHAGDGQVQLLADLRVLGPRRRPRPRRARGP